MKNTIKLPLVNGLWLTNQSIARRSSGSLIKRSTGKLKLRKRQREKERGKGYRDRDRE